MDEKEYGDENFIYAMALMEELESREKEQKKDGEEQEGEEH